MKIITLFIFTLPLFGFAKKDLHYLNAYPKTQNFFNMALVLENSIIDAKKSNSSHQDLEDDHLRLIYTFGHSLSVNEYLTIAVSFINSYENEIKSGSEVGNNYRSKGFREPTFGYNKRLVENHDKDKSISQFGIKFTPSLIDKKSGTKKANRVVGGHILNLHASKGAIYTRWEAKVLGNYTYFFPSKDQNLNSGSTYTRDSYYEIILGIEIQYALNDKWYINSGSGIMLTHDTQINNSDTDEDTQIQLGTGSIGYLGMTYKEPDHLYRFKIFRSKNDFFVEGKNNNFEGSFNKFYLAFDYTKQF
jgi:hypothetical protein